MDYLASYDVESIEHCVEGTRAIAALHRRRGLAATFFVVGRCIEERGDDLRAVLDDPLFDVQSHTYSHAILKPNRVHGPGVAADEARREIVDGARLVREGFGRPCVGLRTGCGYAGGFAGATYLLEACVEAGLEYISSDLRGPGDSLPAPLTPPHTYEGDGFPGLQELPVHGWHDNVLKGYCRDMALVAYPPEEDWQIPARAPRTPREHAEHHLRWVDGAREAGLLFVSLAFHPWSLHRYDPSLGELESIFDGVAERGIAVVTATAAARAARGNVRTGGAA